MTLRRIRTQPGTLPDLFVPAAGGRLVRLANVASLRAGMSPGQIERYAQERSITLVSNLCQKPLAEAYKEAYAAVTTQQMPPECGIVTTGRGKLLLESILGSPAIRTRAAAGRRGLRGARTCSPPIDNRHQPTMAVAHGQPHPGPIRGPRTPQPPPPRRRRDATPRGPAASAG